MKQGKHRIVIKVGPSTLTNENGKVSFYTIERMARAISDLQNQGNQVGECHQAVEHIVHIPDQLAADDCRRNDKENVENFENENKSPACFFVLYPLETEFACFFAVIRPCHNGGERKKRKDNAEGNGSECAEVAGKHGERHGGIVQLGKLFGGCVGNQLVIGAYKHQRRQGADDKRVKEHFENAPESLLDRLTRFGGGVCDDRRSESCLVGKNAA